MAKHPFAIERPRKIRISIEGYDAQARTRAQQRKQQERQQRLARRAAAAAADKNQPLVEGLAPAISSGPAADLLASAAPPPAPGSVLEEQLRQALA